MAGKKDIKNRIRAVQNTQKVTKSMKLISTIKLKQLQNLSNATRSYNEQIHAILFKTLEKSQFLFMDASELPAIMRPRKTVNNVCVIINSSDRGLCGPYNSQLLKMAQAHITELTKEGKKVSLILLGNKAISFARKNLSSCNVLQSFGNLPMLPENEFARQIWETIQTEYTENRIDSVEILYSRFVSMIKSQVTLSTLLPLSLDQQLPQEQIKSKNEALIHIEPSPISVLNALLPLYCQNQIYQAMVLGRASELANRVNAMGAATDNAKVLIEHLTLSFNKARQAAITQEISEIVAGAESVR